MYMSDCDLGFSFDVTMEMSELSIADILPVCNAFVTSAAKLHCVWRGLRPSDVNQLESLHRGAKLKH